MKSNDACFLSQLGIKGIIWGADGNRRRGEREVADQRLLCDGDFVKQVIAGLDDLVKKNLRLSGQRIVY